ncbi:CoA-transferase family III [Rhizodiscina lignyota]|uniref:CoA-transferase family III n=1 Tax=Rhizodiscina lignyota TaxID=1504668 RepID=A0A9P4M0Q6_9PEZI|nr:CoA-transferase family III [Rhizodiscina lignyota]
MASVQNNVEAHQNGISGELPPGAPDRSSFTTMDSVKHIWLGMGLPKEALDSISFSDEGLGLPSSFKVGHIAQASIGLSVLVAALIHSLRNNIEVPHVSVPLRHACAEFLSERFCSVAGQKFEHPWALGGLYKASDGYVRIHDAFPNHRFGALALLGLGKDATREDIRQKVLKWAAIDLEREAFNNKIVIAALRSYMQWDAAPHSKAIATFPIQIRKLAPGPKGLSPRIGAGADKCLRGVRVVEMSRVIATPVAGRTLAAHGADVIWVTSPNLPDLPNLDRDSARGKRSIQLDIRVPQDKAKLLELLKDADIFIQGYRPGSLAAKGLEPEELVKINPNIICGSLCAYGNSGPWAKNRGFDSLVQTCSGMNVSEAEHYGDGSPARPTPCQALDHGSGYFLATAVMAALYKRATEGGSYAVDVSLAATMKYLRSLGQYEGKSGFACDDMKKAKDVEELMARSISGFGEYHYLTHSAQIDGVKVGWDRMPVPLGSDEAVWI